MQWRREGDILPFPPEKMRKTVFIIIFLIITARLSFAGGLSTTFGEVVVDDLAVGKAYSMKNDAKFPLSIKNTSSQTVSLLLEVLYPEKSELKKGYEAIPDVSWIKLEQNSFEVAPEASATTDVIISVPDKKKYSGMKYQVYIWSHTIGKAIGVGLKSKLLLTVRDK